MEVVEAVSVDLLVEVLAVVSVVVTDIKTHKVPTKSCSWVLLCTPLKVTCSANLLMKRFPTSMPQFTSKTRLKSVKLTKFSVPLTKFSSLSKFKKES